MLVEMWPGRICDGGELICSFTNGSDIPKYSFKSGRYLNKEEAEQVQTKGVLTLLSQPLESKINVKKVRCLRTDIICRLIFLIVCSLILGVCLSESKQRNWHFSGDTLLRYFSR